MKKLKMLSEILSVNLTSIRWKLTSYFLRLKMKEEKLLLMKKV